MADAMGERHLAVCRRFGESVRAAKGKWERPSPCDAWDARGVLEHVIGFHDVLVHTWDLARAVGADDRLDPGWCGSFYAALPDDPGMFIGSAMFDAPVAVADQTDVQSKLLARLGRNPDWQSVGSEIWHNSPRG